MVIKDRICESIDPDIFDLFINGNLFMEYAKSELRPEKIDGIEK